MARKTKEAQKNTFKEFSFDGKEFKFSGRLYPENAKETQKCTITPASITLNGVITIKGCSLFQTDNNAWIVGPQYKSGDDYKDYLYWPKEYNDEIDGLVKAMEAALE